MSFETEVFISYAHLDNQCARQGHEWISEFHHALQIRTGMLLGRQPEIWRDPKIQGNDCFADTLLERLRHVAVLVSILSPRYIKSEWTRRELEEFCHVADETGGLSIANKARIFKIVKTPIPRETELPLLERLLGYEFFTIDPKTGRDQELDDPDDKEYWTKINDVAHDVCEMLEILEGEGKPAARDKKTVYLAETTFDVRAEYLAIKRDLQEHGHTVLPSRPLPALASELNSFVQQELQQCDLSVHLVGRNYSFVPEGGMQSVLELQDELGLKRAEKGNFARLVWIAPGLEIEDQRQRNFVERLRMNPRIQKTTDLLETSIEDLKTVLHDLLKPKAAEVHARPNNSSGLGLRQLYFIFDRRDQEVMLPWCDYLFTHFEVISPVFEGDETEIRAFHEENLRTSDAVLIHYGAGGEIWLRHKLAELRKSAAYGRTEPFRAIGVSIAPPLTPQKRLFKTHEAMVISQPEGFSPDPLLPFIDLVKGN